jgi:hypothetical protein
LAAPAGLGIREHRRKFYQAPAEDLLIFAEHQFRLGRALSDGATERDHRSSAAEQWAKLGRRDLARKALPLGPPFPIELRYLWHHFREHSLGLQINGMCPPTITWEGLQAWAMFMRLELEPWEALTLVKLGYLRAAVESEGGNGSQHQDRPGREAHGRGDQE